MCVCVCVKPIATMVDDPSTAHSSMSCCRTGPPSECGLGTDAIMMWKDDAILGHGFSIHQDMIFGKVGTAQGKLEVIQVDNAAKVPWLFRSVWKGNRVT